MNKRLIKLVNGFYPGFGGCYRCGRNWGWTKYTTHPTTNGGGLLLFCVGCDKVVTPQERWKALDAWKADSLRQLSILEAEKEAKRINSIEFTEFPRS